MSNIERRARVLRAYGATGDVVEELLGYNTSRVDLAALLTPRTYPLPDEEFVSTWIEYADHARSENLFEFLKTRLVQLNFPIREGISRSEDYIVATKRGQSLIGMPSATGLLLEQPAQLSLAIYQTPAGKIPILYTPHRPDFVSLLRAMASRNEPQPVPDSMGACIVSGYNNWDRIRAFRTTWQLRNDRESLSSGWNEQFSRLISRKELYQDRFLLLSGAYYSNVAPSTLGLSDTEWRTRSVVIGREHECAHYFMPRVFGSIRNDLLDELIADYIGMVAASGCFRADWFMHFMGLEDFPAYRDGGRFENYSGEPPLSEPAFRVQQALLTAAAQSLERFTSGRADLLGRHDFQPPMITALSTLTLEGLADAAAQETLYQVVRHVDRLKLSLYLEVS